MNLQYLSQKILFSILTILLIVRFSTISYAQSCEAVTIDNLPRNTGSSIPSAQNNVTQTFRATITGNLSNLRVLVSFNVNDGSTRTNTLKLEIKDQGVVIGTLTRSVSYGGGSDTPVDFSFGNIAVPLDSGKTYSFTITRQGSELIFYRQNSLYPFGFSSDNSNLDVRFSITMRVNNPLSISLNNFSCSEFPILHISDGGVAGSDYLLFQDGELIEVIQTDSVEIIGIGSYHVEKTLFPGCTVISDTLEIQNLPPLLDSTLFVTDSVLINGQYYGLFDEPIVDNFDNNGCLVSRTFFYLYPAPRIPNGGGACETFLKTNDNAETISNGPNLANSSFTVAVWLKRTRTNSEEIFYRLGSENSVNKALHLGFRANGNILLGFYGNDFEMPAISDLNWHHYAFSYNEASKIQEIYKDGVKLSQRQTNANFIGNTTALLGTFQNASNAFNGFWEDFQIWNTRLTPEEILLVYKQQNNTRPESKLVHFEFNDIRGINELKNSANNTTISLSNIQTNIAIRDSLDNPAGKVVSFSSRAAIIGDSVSVNGVTFTADTVIIDTLLTAVGCDSIHNFIIKFNTIEQNCNTVLYLTDKKDQVPGGPNLANKSFSISLWAKRKKVVNGAGPLEITFRLGTEDAARKALHLGWRENGNILFGFGSNDLEAFRTPDNNWHHYTFVYDRNSPNTASGVMKIYYDGLLISTANNKNDFTGNTNMRFGVFSMNDPVFNGFLEDLQIWKDVALTDAEVLAVYNNDFTVKAQNKTHHFEFNDVRGRDRFKNSVDNTFYNLTNIKTAASLTDSLGNSVGATAGPDQNIQLKGGQTFEIEGIQVSRDSTFDVRYTNTLGCDSLVRYTVSVDFRFDPDTSDCNLVLKTDGVKTETFTNAGPDFANKSFSASFWVKRDRINVQEVYFSLGSEINTNKVMHLGFRADNKVFFGFTNADLEIDALADTEWHHYLFVYDLAEPANKKKIYKDGFLIAQGAGSAFTGNTNIILGAFPDGGAKFKGQVEDITLWDRVLTSEEVLEYHLGDKSIGDLNKKLIWDFQEILGQNVITNRVDNSTVTPNVFNRNTDIVNLNGAVKGNSVSNLSITACQPFDFNGTLITTSGVYVDTLINAVGCDSIITLNLTSNVSINNQNLVICSSYDFNGALLTTSGTYVDTLTNALGCDSIIFLDLTILPVKDSSITISHCGPYNYNGNIFSSSGIYKDTLTNAFGCDSIFTLNLTILEVKETSLNVSNCGPFDFNGVSLNSSGIYIDTLGSSAGCDSIVTLNLTILSPDSTFLIETACNFYDFFGQNLEESGRYFHNLQNANGCDSVIVLDLTVNTSTFSETTVTSCGSYLFHDSLFTQSTTYSFSVPNAAGCDSVVVLGLIIKNPSSSQLTVNKCDSFDFNGKTLISSGVYSDTLVNAVGCDSVVILNLTILQPSSTSVNRTACGSFTFDGQTLTSSGVFTGTFQNAAGCDSVVTLTLSINQPATATLSGSRTIIQGQSALLEVLFTGTPPFNVVINGQYFTGITQNPFRLQVSPVITTVYHIGSVTTAACGAGNFNGSATVTVNVDNSPCPQNLQVPTGTDPVYRAADYLNSHVNAGSQTLYKAGKAILLEPGFQVGVNEVFEARIAGCN